MDFTPRPNPKPKDPPSEISESFGLVTTSDDMSNPDADAEALFTEFAGSSSESDDDDTAAGGAAAGSAAVGGAAGGSALSSAAHDLQQISSTKDTMTQQQHRIRGKHGKLKKMGTKYRHQEESEREEALQVRPCSHLISRRLLQCSHT